MIVIYLIIITILLSLLINHLDYIVYENFTTKHQKIKQSYRVAHRNIRNFHENTKSNIQNTIRNINK